MNGRYEMKKFEYKYFNFEESDRDDNPNFLHPNDFILLVTNKIGDQGWEIVTMKEEKYHLYDSYGYTSLDIFAKRER
jgi:hypothetical protein